MRYLTIALTKGRLAEKTLEMLEAVGITCEEMKDKKTRKLIFVNEDLKLRFFLAKGPDVPTYVEYGAADLGVVGRDTILEEGRKLYEVMDLGFGKCRMCICGPESARELLDGNQQIRVATKYPNIAKDYFYNKKNQTVEIIKLNGSIELAPIVGLSEVICDIVETGSTLRENGLHILEEVCPLSARVVVNQVSMKMETPQGTMLGQKVTPLEKVGVYVPGGKAVYPSSVLMNIMPAKVAGVDKIIMTTPCNAEGKVNPAVLVAAKEAGADEVYKAGGAQAIAALAFGTESIPKVDKIVGPGNIYVALAKKAVYGHVSIDSIAGPSEILVLADETANPRYVAADLLSQAEHDELASAILITTSEDFAKKVSEEVEGFVQVLERKAIIQKSLDNFGYILVAEDMDEAIDTANEIASEHLEIVTANPFEVMTKIRNAGAIFIGEYSCEPLGDYFAGPNHILPTNGTAKFFSPLSVDDFVKKSSIIYYSREALQPIHKDIEQFAKCEQLTAHANSIAVRFEGEE